MESYQRIMIRRISVGSAFRIGLRWSLAISAFFGFLSLLLYGEAASIALVTWLTRDEVMEIFNLIGGGLLSEIIPCLILIIFYGIVGGIVTALSAIFYNFLARTNGGLEIDI